MIFSQALEQFRDIAQNQLLYLLLHYVMQELPLKLKKQLYQRKGITVSLQVLGLSWIIAKTKPSPALLTHLLY